ncbi:MAG: hypothetical protein WBX22_13090 [Silvibacterium sp.]
MANPESVERRSYNGLVIEVELYRRSEGGFYAWPYIEKTHPNGTSKQHFILNDERFATKEEALQAALAEGQKIIDQGEQPDFILGLVNERLQTIEASRQAVIDKGAHEGKTIATETVLRSLEASKGAYQGADRAAYTAAADKLAREFREKYPDTIPIDEAYRLMKEWE